MINNTVGEKASSLNLSLNLWPLVKSTSDRVKNFAGSTCSNCFKNLNVCIKSPHFLLQYRESRLRFRMHALFIDCTVINLVAQC